MSKKLGSSYIGSNNIVETAVSGKRKSFIAVILSSSLAFVILALALQPILLSVLGNFSNDSNKSVISYANAGEPGFVCSTDFGMGMDGDEGWSGLFNLNAYPEYGHREITLQEAFGSSGLEFVAYHGEGEAADRMGVRAKETPTPSGLVLGNSSSDFETLYAKNLEKLEAERRFSNCFQGSILPFFANMTLKTANAVTSLAQFSSAMVFNSNIICSDTNTDYCLDLVGIIGGDGNTDGGIIGVLTSSVYYPLLVIAVAITALWVAKKGLIDRKLREALFGVIWMVLSVIFGLALLLNPLLITKAPMAVSNVVSTCVIGAFNGQNCFNGGSSDSLDYETSGGPSSSENICRSSSLQASMSEQMVFTTNSITCSIWRAFVLEPATQGSFGTSFNELDVYANPQLNALLVQEGLSPAAYCVNLASTRSLDSAEGGYLQLDSSRNRVCNLMAYQMYLKTKATTNGDTNFSGPDEKWYRVIMATAADDGLWSNWTNTGNGFQKLAVSVIALIASGLGTSVILVSAVMALVYYLSSVILLAFAPLFFLLGVHPGKGKAMFLGWLEKVISNVLKYMASAVFLVVAISIYGGILGNISNIGLTLLFVIIVTMALFMYRSELIGLLGRANMGGEKLSNSMADKLGGMAKDKLNLAKNTVVSGAGGAVGAAITSDALGKPWRLREMAADIGAGTKDGVKRQLKRDTGFVGNIARQYDRNTVDNKQDLRAKGQDALEEIKRTEGTMYEAKEHVDGLEEDRAARMKQGVDDRDALAILDEEYKETKAAEKAILNDHRDMVQKSYLDDSDKILRNSNLTAEEKSAEIDKLKESREDALNFVQLQELMNSLRDDKIQLEIAVKSGDEVQAMEIRERMSVNTNKVNTLRSGISDVNMKNNKDMYQSALQSKIELKGKIVDVDEDMANEIIDRTISSGRYDSDMQRLDDDIFEARKIHHEAEKAYKLAEYEEKAYNDKFISLRPGEGMNDRDVEKLDNEIAKEKKAMEKEMDKEFYAKNGRPDPSESRLAPIPESASPTADSLEDEHVSYYEKNDLNPLTPSAPNPTVPEEKPEPKLVVKTSPTPEDPTTKPNNGDDDFGPSGGIPRGNDPEPKGPSSNGGSSQLSNPVEPPATVNEETLRANEDNYLEERTQALQGKTTHASGNPVSAPVKPSEAPQSAPEPEPTQTPTDATETPQKPTGRKPKGIPTRPQRKPEETTSSPDSPARNEHPEVGTEEEPQAPVRTRGNKPPTGNRKPKKGDSRAEEPSTEESIEEPIVTSPRRKTEDDFEKDETEYLGERRRGLPRSPKGGFGPRN